MTNQVRAIWSDMNNKVNFHLGDCMKLDNISVWSTFLWLSSWKNTDVFAWLEGPTTHWWAGRGTGHTHRYNTHYHTHYTPWTVLYSPPNTHSHTCRLSCMLKNPFSLSHTHTFSHIILMCGILHLYCGKCFSFEHARPHNAGSKFLSGDIIKWATLSFLKEGKNYAFMLSITCTTNFCQVQKFLYMYSEWNVNIHRGIMLYWKFYLFSYCTSSVGSLIKTWYPFVNSHEINCKLSTEVLLNQTSVTTVTWL